MRALPSFPSVPSRLSETRRGSVARFATASSTCDLRDPPFTFLPFESISRARGGESSRRTLERGWGGMGLSRARGFPGASPLAFYESRRRGPSFMQRGERLSVTGYTRLFPMHVRELRAILPLSTVLHITGVRLRNYARSGRVNVKICMKLLCTRLTFASNTATLPPPLPPAPKP